MKCYTCKEKKGKRFCIIDNNYICSLCCGTNRNLRRCNSMCEYYPSETTDRMVISNFEITQVNNGKVILFANNCFLPNIFDLLVMHIKNFEIFILDYGTIRVKLNFIIKENKDKTKRKVNPNEIYLKDSWKKEDNGINENLVPLIQIYTMKGGKSNLNGNQYKLDNKNINTKKISNYLNTFLPYSTNKLEKIVTKEFGPNEFIISNVCSGDYFQGKNDTYYGELKLNQEYFFDFEIEYEELTIKNNILAYPFGIFLPFELINVDNFKIYTSSDIEFSDKSLVHLTLPVNGKIENSSFKPLEGNENCFFSKSGVSLKLEDMNPPFHYDRYAIELYDLGVLSKKELICRSIYSDLPIQLGIYESLNHIYDNIYSPIKISIVNNTDNIKSIEIFAKIENLSDELKQSIQLLPREYKLIYLSPILKVEEKNRISDITKRNIKLQVTTNNEVLIDETHEISVFPKNLFIFSMENQEKNWKVSLTPHLARFVTPHDPCIVEIHSKASRKMPLLGYLSNNRETLLSEIENIYNVLGENYELQYVIDSYGLGPNKYKKQSIKLPREVISTKCGNCIEFTLLLASCLEMLNLDVYIVLVPGHAFLGIKLFETEKIYIETTMIGKRTFMEAVIKGREYYEKNFEGDSIKVSGAEVISIKECRKIEIYPFE